MSARSIKALRPVSSTSSVMARRRRSGLRNGSKRSRPEVPGRLAARGTPTTSVRSGGMRRSRIRPRTYSADYAQSRRCHFVRTERRMATEPRALTVNDIIDERPLSSFQLKTILLCSLVLLLDGFDTQAMGFLVPPISEELGIPLSAFGTVLSAGLFGLMIGAMSAGPIADRWGRKWAIIVSALVFGFFSLLTAGADSIRELVTLRFLTGLGLGGAMPNVVALASEYAPKRLQPILVPAIFSGMGAGAVLASFVGGALIPSYGWRSVFIVGGILPIVLAVILIKALPESLRFLAAKGADRQRISGIVRKIAPEHADVAFVPPPA